MENKALYNDYGSWIRKQFPFRVQKISVNAGFSCPNRDGRISHGGCIYCNNNTFSPLCPARSAATYPAGPPPIMIKSYIVNLPPNPLKGELS